MTRVLLDCRPVRDPISGVARYCLGLSEALTRLARQEFDHFVQTQRGKNSFVSLLPTSDTQISSRIFAGDRRIQNALLEYLPRLQSLLIPGQHDILHETYFANLGTRHGKPKLATIHDIIPLDRPEFFSRRNVIYSKRNFHRQAREADHIIAVSEFTRQRILDFYPEAENRISVIGNGVDASILNRPVAQRLKPDDTLAQRPFVGFVGNVEPRKNLVTMARGFDQAFPKGSGWQMVIAGRMNFDADRILTEITSILGDRFTYLGPVDEARKWQVLAHAQAVVMASEYEGFGIPIYEGYAVDTPVMIANNSSMTELAVTPQQLFPTFSPDALAEGLRAIADGADWVEHARKSGANRVASQSWDEVAMATSAIYEKLA
ncbi:glycosyltransferase family 1 protein [Aliiroseovarius sp. KMU-50]|uniref:Glycosyltransferase family 1 protein n=1 Tax=Aliiroseovarius salicola TaxID=3009082 RepID=A0ABT4VXU4_9RHOB|nr:glycosyltransferase family 1 protein [Aliiroseovarius sp. KMU-50]MDA5093072.1 glycosyltransferase family 1 protein [Aliiroseovarius sp. KMU-50]